MARSRRSTDRLGARQRDGNAPGVLHGDAGTGGLLVAPFTWADADPLDRLHEAIRHLVSWDGRHGSDDIAGPALHLFRGAHRALAAGRYPAAAERDLTAATAELGEVAGWLLYDADRQAEARAANLSALGLARRAGDRNLELFVLTNMAMQSHHAGRHRESLRIATAGAEDPRLPPRVAALFRVRAARVLADLGGGSAARAEVGRARAGISGSITRRDPQWTWWVAEREITWHHGQVCGSGDDWAEAVEHFSTAADLLDPDYRRGHHNHLAHLLDALVRVRDWPAVAEVAETLVPLTEEVSSGRVTTLLRRSGARARGDGAPDSVTDVLAALGQHPDGPRSPQC